MEDAVRLSGKGMLAEQEAVSLTPLVRKQLWALLSPSLLFPPSSTGECLPHLGLPFTLQLDFSANILETLPAVCSNVVLLSFSLLWPQTQQEATAEGNVCFCRSYSRIQSTVTGKVWLEEQEWDYWYRIWYNTDTITAIGWGSREWTGSQARLKHSYWPTFSSEVPPTKSSWPSQTEPGASNPVFKWISLWGHFIRVHGNGLLILKVDTED